MNISSLFFDSSSPMAVYNIYIFDRNWNCIYYYEWLRRKQSGLSRDEDIKLMRGLVSSLRDFTTRISPVDMPSDSFLSFYTNQYKLHLFQSPTGVRIVLNTESSCRNLKEELRQVYNNILVEYVVKNPLCSLNSGNVIKSLLFEEKLNEFMASLNTPAKWTIVVLCDWFWRNFLRDGRIFCISRESGFESFWALLPSRLWGSVTEEYSSLKFYSSLFIQKTLMYKWVAFSSFCHKKAKKISTSKHVLSVCLALPSQLSCLLS